MRTIPCDQERRHTVWFLEQGPEGDVKVHYIPSRQWLFLTRQIGRNFTAQYALLRPRVKKTWHDTKPLTRRTRERTAAIAGRRIRGMTTSRDIKKGTESKA